MNTTIETLALLKVNQTMGRSAISKNIELTFITSTDTESQY